MYPRTIDLRKNITGLVLLCATLNACSSNFAMPPTYAPSTRTPSPYHTPNIPNWGSTPTIDLPSLPGILSCIILPSSHPHPGKVSWKGLSVGISTFEDVRNTLMSSGNDNYAWNTQKGHFGLVNPWFVGRSDSRLKDDWHWVESCFVEDTLAAISIRGAVEFEKPFSDFIAESGEPDRITWTDSYSLRSAIWAEKGLLAVVDFQGNTPQIIQTILFSPIPRCELEKSWIFEHLPKDGQKFSGDEGMNFPDIEDPYGSEKGLSDCAMP